MSVFGFACLIVYCLGYSNAYTPPFMFRDHHRSGKLYKEALELHEAHRELYGLNHTSNITVSQLDQLIDHTDPSAGLFKQTFWMDLTNINSPRNIAFLYINGESAGSHMDGYAAMLAQEFDAMTFALEHRFYGSSMPSPLTDHAGLKHLTVENALADLVSFMDYVENKIVGRSLGWVSVGGSYAGALSAWLKVKYPHRIVAAWSSSGVVHAKLDFTAFDGHIASVLPADCLSKTKELVRLWEQLYDNDDTREELKSLFGIPSYFTREEATWNFMDGVSQLVQYGKKTEYCSSQADTSSPDVQIRTVSRMLKQIFPDLLGSCSYSTACMTDPTQADQWGPSGVSWIYQTCTQLGYFQVAYPGSLRPDTVSTDFFIKQCKDVFGPSTLPDVFSFNAVFGGAQPNATNVIALQGSDDPWIEVGVRKNLNPSYLAFVAECDNCGHCGDLSFPSHQDPPSLQKQRQYIREVLHNWLD